MGDFNAPGVGLNFAIALAADEALAAAGADVEVLAVISNEL
jgi:hypothetical protein